MAQRNNDPRSGPPQLTLAGAVYGFVVVTTFVMFVAGALLLLLRADRLLDQALDSAVRLRTQAAAHNFARSLNDDWLDLSELARQIPAQSSDRLRGMMDGIKADGRRISWIGYADVTGIVVTASGGMLEDADVSARPWFRNGMRGGFAGDVHEALLLAKRLPRPADGGTLRFVDLALPVTDGNGDLRGVAGMHIDFAWAQAALREQARGLALDLFLVGTDGTVIAASTPDVPTPDTLTILRGAQLGVMTAGRETWPDGREYFSSVVPNVGYADLPAFGWRLVGRLDAQAFRPNLAILGGIAFASLLGVLGILAAATAFFVAVFIRPVSNLSRIADRIADGADIFPPETRITWEAASLSSALARFQHRRKKAD